MRGMVYVESEPRMSKTLPYEKAGKRPRPRSSLVTTYKVSKSGEWLCVSCGCRYGEQHRSDCTPVQPPEPE